MSANSPKRGCGAATVRGSGTGAQRARGTDASRPTEAADSPAAVRGVHQHPDRVGECPAKESDDQERDEDRAAEDDGRLEDPGTALGARPFAHCAAGSPTPSASPVGSGTTSRT